MCHPVFSTKEFDSGVHIQEFRVAGVQELQEESVLEMESHED